MEMNLGRTLCVPVFLLVWIGLEAKNPLDFQGRRGWNLRLAIFGVAFSLATGSTKEKGKLIPKTETMVLVLAMGRVKGVFILAHA